MDFSDISFTTPKHLKIHFHQTHFNSHKNNKDSSSAPTPKLRNKARTKPVELLQQRMKKQIRGKQLSFGNKLCK